MATKADVWLYAADAAELAGVTADAWRAGSRAERTNARYPAPTRRCPDTGRPQWREADVRAYLTTRTARGAATGQDTHDAVMALLNGRLTESDIAFRLGLHVRTVRRHLSGQCVCRST